MNQLDKYQKSLISCRTLLIHFTSYQTVFRSNQRIPFVMRLYSVSINLLICVALISCSEYYFPVNYSTTSGNGILVKIIQNFLIKYFGGEKTHLSIICSSSEVIHSYFWNELIFHFVNSQELENASYNILEMLDNSVRYHGRTIKLIFIDDIKSLP